jgi:Tfp pilus assembly protein PilZ
MERRRHARHERNFPIRFGNGESEFEGVTRDLSAGGLFVITRDLFPAATRVWLQVVLEPQRPLSFEGVVVRQLPGPRRSGGFGVRFLTPAEVLARYFPEAEGQKAEAVQLVFATPKALAAASERGLIHGYAFVWSNEAHSVGARLDLTVALPFVDQTLDTRATVMQVVEDGARFGFALALDDTTRVRELIEKTVGESAR